MLRTSRQDLQDPNDPKDDRFRVLGGVAVLEVLGPVKAQSKVLTNWSAF